MQHFTLAWAPSVARGRLFSLLIRPRRASPMSGPVATVLIPEPLSVSDRAAVRGLIAAVSDHDLDEPPTLDAFWVCNTRLIGGSYTGGGRPFAVEIGLQPDWVPG